MDLLIKLWADPKLVNADIAERLGRSTTNVSEKAKHLGLPHRKPGQRVGGTWAAHAKRKTKPVRGPLDDGEDRTETGYCRNITLVTSCETRARIKVKIRDTVRHL